MIQKGECLCCRRVGTCLETSIERVLQSHTCPLFEGISEPEYLARVDIMNLFGAESAVRAMLNREEKPNG